MTPPADGAGTAAAPQPGASTDPQAPEGLPPRPGGLLAALRWAWDGAYVITPDPAGGLLVTRADGYGSFRVASPLEARDAIREDHARLPVAWPLKAGTLGRRLDFERAHPEVTWVTPSAYYRVTWDAEGGPQEEVAVTVDGMLGLLRSRGFKW
jgi:hypothetical protein